MTAPDWVPGDMLGMPVPAHAEALRAGGAAFHTDAFRAVGTLAADNSVSRITQFEECPGGSTGRKLRLSVVYERSAPGLHAYLFVKFSRDFHDALRDRARDQMEPEVRFALLTRIPGFPIAVPACCFADFHRESGTGILIAERIVFGTGGIERHYGKCLDYDMPDPLAHYRALITALARLAGAHRGGRLSDHMARRFPFDAGAWQAKNRIRYRAQQLQNRVARFAALAARFSRLLPANIIEDAFTSRLMNEVPRFLEHESAIKQFLYSADDLIALCHWNANVDNAWFWRNARGELECGLLDWGEVGQMNVALALFGSLSGAETSLWNEHFDELLALFVTEFRGCGGPALNVSELKIHLHLSRR
jgi:hypothetical protein